MRATKWPRVFYLRRAPCSCARRTNPTDETLIVTHARTARLRTAQLEAQPTRVVRRVLTRLSVAAMAFGLAALGSADGAMPMLSIGEAKPAAEALALPSTAKPKARAAATDSRVSARLTTRTGFASGRVVRWRAVSACVTISVSFDGFARRAQLHGARFEPKSRGHFVARMARFPHT